MHPPPVRRFTTQGLLQGLRQVLSVLSPLLPSRALTVALWLLVSSLPVRAQGVDVTTLSAFRSEGTLALEFTVRLSLPRAVEEALQRGVPIYFLAEAQLLRNRWYWRDERVARAARSWRLAYQPLTGFWRVGQGGLNQTYPNLAEALAVATRSANWKLADLGQIDNDKSYYVEFSYKLDTTQLPGPMQFGLGGQGDWAVGASRVLRVELGPP